MHRRGEKSDSTVNEAAFEAASKSDDNNDHQHHDENEHAQSWSELPSTEKRDAALLVLLYMIQAVPMGLTFGTLPFVLKHSLSYTQLGTFLLASYPFSLKLFWSPIVDSVFSPRIGRRKSWIIPTQFILAILFFVVSYHVEDVLKSGTPNLLELTVVFFIIIAAAATQDIAVDGWALSLLSKRNVGYASTCQTIGLTIGGALSFTLFLPLSSGDFCRKYLWFMFSGIDEIGILEIGPFMRFWAFVYVIVSLWLLVAKDEEKGELPNDLSLTAAYSQMWKIIRLPSIRKLIPTLLIMRFGFMAADSLTQLELVDRGFSKEQIAFTSFIDVPTQMILSVVVVKYSKSLTPFINTYKFRILLSISSIFLVRFYPGPDQSTWYFGLIVCYTILSTMASTLAFSAICAFFARISDPVIGGTYLTLLNTLANFGGTWPKWFLFYSVDNLTFKSCANSPNTVCEKDVDCGNGSCETNLDGFYPVSIFCVSVGVVLLWLFVFPSLRHLDKLPKSMWAITSYSQKA